MKGCSFSLVTILIVCYINDAVSVDLPFLKKCQYQDHDCFRLLWQNAVPYLSNGIEEFGMPPLDPLKISNVKIVQPNLFEINFIEGIMKGYKTCSVDNFVWDVLEKGHAGAEIDLHCNITIKGRYNATASTTILPGLSSEDTFKADGEMKLKLPNLKLKIILNNFKIVKNEGGQTILLLQTPIKFKNELAGTMTIKANKIFLAKEDISPIVVNVINSNSKSFFARFNKPFFKKAMEIIGDVIKQFFINVPTNQYLVEDIDGYVE